MINITNYNEHPTRKAYTIFHFFNKERADYFKQLLKEHNIWFEADIDKTPEKTTYFFGVKNSNLTDVYKINYLVNAKFRKPSISNKPLRIIIYLITLLLLTLGVLGYLKT
ncbi:MAG: hypothetical protein AB7O47_05400 [Flavobacteriales bacterium]